MTIRIINTCNQFCLHCMQQSGPETFARIIVESFKDYTSSSSYIKARNKVEEYLAKLTNGDSTVLKSFTILEKDVEHLL